MCKVLICHDMLRSETECLLLLNINFVNSGKECKKATTSFLMNLLNYIEEENLDKNNENLKYLNDISGNLLQIFEGKDITSNLETNAKFFMSETVCQFFLGVYFYFIYLFIYFFFCYARRKKNIFLSKHTSVWTVEIFLSEIMSMWLGVTCVSALYYIWPNWSQHRRRLNKICLLGCFYYYYYFYSIYRNVYTLINC